jgi:hypothetical protein
MSAWPRFPFIYEINTWAWLHALSKQCQQPVTLGEVPPAELDRLAGWGFDALWFMGVWERSPRSAQIAREHPALQEEFRRALPDYTPEDVVGSPYAVHRYVVDAHLGGPEGLAAVREALAARGLRLVLDFVPNHVAIDHPWTVEHPEYLVQGTDEDLQRAPGDYFAADVDGRRVVYAHGRDPSFLPWTDTAQINAASAGARRALVGVLQDIAEQCDGVRCDMAMLPTNSIFSQTWEERGTPGAAGDQPEFWEVIIPQVRAAHPDFLFIAEVYWDLEWTLQQQGFDYTYDKRLYDRLRAPDARPTRDHLRAEMIYQERLLRFIENHDERRAPAAFGARRAKAAAVLICTVPGARLLHNGQLEGQMVKAPVQLGRHMVEPVRDAMPDFYARLLGEVTDPVYQEGEWTLLNVSPAWQANATYTNLVAYAWTYGNQRRLVAVNLMPTQSQGVIHMPWPDLRGRQWLLQDIMHDQTYRRDGDELTTRGLYVDLPAHGYHLFHVRPEAGN